MNGRTAYGVTWRDVGVFGGSADDKRNTFQMILIDRSDTGAGNFDLEFNYDQIQWETGSASGGSDGLGGSSARAGYSNGTGDAGTFFEIAGSAVNGAFLDGGPNALVSSSIGSIVDGRYLFEGRAGSLVEAPSAVPVPATLPLLAAAVGGLAAAHRRHRRA